MFMAECVTYAVVGGLLGFLQGLLMINVGSSLMPGQMFFNYGSTWVVMSLFFAIFATLVASGYPLLIASRLVTPSLERAWRIPTSPVGTEWDIPLPFHATHELDALALLEYIREFTEAHMTADASVFIVRGVREEAGEKEGAPYKALVLDVALQPTELGITQTATLYTSKRDDRWEFQVHLSKLSGPTVDWIGLTRSFIAQIREQMLIWRGLPLKEKEAYLKRATERAQRR
jgi:hypothetical protein